MEASTAVCAANYIKDAVEAAAAADGSASGRGNSGRTGVAVRAEMGWISLYCIS